MRSTADKTTPCPTRNGVEFLAAAAVPIWIDGQARIAHQDNGDRRRGHAYGFDDELDSRARCQLRKPQPRLLARFCCSLPVHRRNPSQCPFDMNGAGTGAGSHREKRASVRADE